MRIHCVMHMQSDIEWLSTRVCWSKAFGSRSATTSYYLHLIFQVTTVPSVVLRTRIRLAEDGHDF